MAEEELGNRSQRVLYLLRRAERFEAGVFAAIDDVEQLSILFVDAGRLRALAANMRARVGNGGDD